MAPPASNTNLDQPAPAGTDRPRRTGAEVGRDRVVLTADESELVRRAMDPSSPFGKRKRHTRTA